MYLEVGTTHFDHLALNILLKSKLVYMMSIAGEIKSIDLNSSYRYLISLFGHIA